MAGFTFNGIHTSTMGCHYRPDAKARGDQMAGYTVKDLTDDSRDGGYYIGARVEPRVFALECYFEDIPQEQQAAIQHWLRRDTYGELIFDDRPHAQYEVVTSKKPEMALYDYTDAGGIQRYSGTFEAHFTAYEPFAKMKECWHENSCDAKALAETGILPAALKPPSPNAQSTSFLIYNPGTEAAHTVIRLAGNVGSGVTIRNLTTGQKCKIVDLTEDSLLETEVLELDSQMEQTRKVLGGSSALAFPFHEEGYLMLAPCTPFVRSVDVSHTAGSNTVTSANGFLPHMKGQYLYIGGWRKIEAVTGTNTAIIMPAVQSSGTTQTPVVTMNEMEIQTEDRQLTHFEMEYSPRLQ